jgi:hypothetical protein
MIHKNILKNVRTKEILHYRPPPRASTQGEILPRRHSWEAPQKYRMSSEDI